MPPLDVQSAKILYALFFSSEIFLVLKMVTLLGKSKIKVAVFVILMHSGKNYFVSVCWLSCTE